MSDKPQTRIEWTGNIQVHHPVKPVTQQVADHEEMRHQPPDRPLK